MKRITYYIIFAVCIFVTSCNDDESKATTSQTDRDFAVEAAYASRAEVELGQLAAFRSKTSTVVNFGQMMVAEHQRALTELQVIANDQHVILPTEIKGEDDLKKQQMMELTDYSFDTLYIHSQVRDHKKSEALFKTEMAKGSNEQLKNYATGYLPAIQMHLAKADSISKAITQ